MKPRFKMTNTFGECPMYEGHRALRVILAEIDFTQREKELIDQYPLQKMTFLKKLNKAEQDQFCEMLTRLETLSNDLLEASKDNEEVA